jgi:hypothetical protein
VARDRYKAPRGAPVSEDEWHERGKAALLDILDRRHACTISEIEAHCADRTGHGAGPWSVNPHHLTNARIELLRAGAIEYTDASTRSHPGLIRTWSLPPTYGRKSKIDAAAARKRLLTARHNGWSERGGRNLGLIGAAGEDAVSTALTSAGSAVLEPTGPVSRILDVDLKSARLGELDNTGTVIDRSDAADPKLVTVLVEVKNTREWIYDTNDGLVRFLGKAAYVQAARPDQLILPVFICRQFQVTAWRLGERHGFLPAMVEQQLVLPDHDNIPESFAEVRDELYPDLVLGAKPTNRHLGIARQGIAKYANRAELWRQHHVLYL